MVYFTHMFKYFIFAFIRLHRIIFDMSAYTHSTMDDYVGDDDDDGLYSFYIRTHATGEKKLWIKNKNSIY